MLIGLFCRVCDEAPDGSLTGWEAEDVAHAADFDGEPAELLRALEDAAFLVTGESGGLEINDWLEYAEGYKAAARKRRARSRKRDGTVPGHGRDMAGTRPSPTPRKPGPEDDRGRDSPVDGRTDGPTDGRTDGRTTPVDGDVTSKPDWPVEPIYSKSLEEWGINHGYGMLPPAKAVEVQQLKCLGLDEVRYAHDQTVRRCRNKPNWGYFLACVKSARSDEPRDMSSGGGGRDYGHAEPSDFSNQPEGLTWLIGGPEEGDNGGSPSDDQPDSNQAQGQGGPGGDSPPRGGGAPGESEIPF